MTAKDIRYFYLFFVKANGTRQDNLWYWQYKGVLEFFDKSAMYKVEQYIVI